MAAFSRVEALPARAGGGVVDADPDRSGPAVLAVRAYIRKAPDKPDIEAATRSSAVH